MSFEQAIIAAGSEPVTLPFIPHDDPRVIDSTGALELGGMPKRLLVVGGGIIGLEMATVYHELGAKVTIVELMDQIIPGADKDIVTPLHKRIAKQYENIFLKAKVTKVEANAGRAGGQLRGRQGARRPTPSTASWWRSAGRPNGRLIGAENAGVIVDERGFIPVDKQMRTNVPHIFAIGDVVGQPMLAHKAVHEGKVAAEAASGMKSFFDAKVIPSVAYTDPEVAWVGLTENEAKAKGVKYGKGVFPWAASGRSLSLGRDEGIDQGPVRRGDAPDHRLRHRRPQRRRPDRRGGAGDRDGGGRRGHRPHHPPAPDPVRDHRHGRRDVRGHHHRPDRAQEEALSRQREARASAPIRGGPDMALKQDFASRSRPRSVWQAQIKEHQERMAQAGEAQAKADYEKAMAQLQDNAEQAQKLLRQVRDANEAAWKDMQQASQGAGAAAEGLGRRAEALRRDRAADGGRTAQAGAAAAALRARTAAGQGGSDGRPAGASGARLSPLPHAGEDLGHADQGA